MQAVLHLKVIAIPLQSGHSQVLILSAPPPLLVLVASFPVLAALPQHERGSVALFAIVGDAYAHNRKR
jgi:hypothetical protein